jgi:hypothetical protein
MSETDHQPLQIPYPFLAIGIKSVVLECETKQLKNRVSTRGGEICFQEHYELIEYQAQHSESEPAVPN